MSQRVVHISNETHRKVKEFCSKAGLSMKDWSDAILSSAADKGVKPSLPKRSASTPRSPKSASGSSRPDSHEPVAKKKMPELERKEQSEGPKPWELEPFWKREAETSKTEKESESGRERRNHLEDIAGESSQGINQDQSRSSRESPEAISGGGKADRDLIEELGDQESGSSFLERGVGDEGAIQAEDNESLLEPDY